MRFQGMAESIWSDVVSKVETKPRGGSRAASRWSAPSPGRRTSREDHALTHRPQMSSGRLFLDRVFRQPCPSPLHRHPQTNMHSQEAQTKGDILTLPGRGHSNFALTLYRLLLTPALACDKFPAQFRRRIVRRSAAIVVEKGYFGEEINRHLSLPLFSAVSRSARKSANRSDDNHRHHRWNRNGPVG
jgi:hypothetical protein